MVIVWSGWVGGIAIGLYVLFQFWVSGQALGVSTGYGNVCALVTRHPFFSVGDYADATNWRLWFTLGIPLGGLVAVVTSTGTFAPTFDMGAMYDRVLPASVPARGLVLVLGGIMIGYGSRLAGGCTSGHSITGSALLNPPSIVASIGFFAGGIAAVQALFAFAG
jgi:hypothetical protein